MKDKIDLFIRQIMKTTDNLEIDQCPKKNGKKNLSNKTLHSKSYGEKKIIIQRCKMKDLNYN